VLTKEENEALCRVGPGTLMGCLMREYWVPAVLSSELPTPDSDPVRVLLLGEKLIAFRDSNGCAGLMDHNCPHRGASLSSAATKSAASAACTTSGNSTPPATASTCPTHAALRSAGACEPAESDFKHKVHATAYPSQGRNGIVWAYLFSRTTPPPLPSLEGDMLPEGEWQVTAIQRECNWFQGLEGDIDTSHFSFLHAGSMDVSRQQPGTFSYYMLADRAPRYSVVDTDFGTMYGAPTATPRTGNVTGAWPISSSRSGLCRRRACWARRSPVAAGCRWTTHTRCSS
jgi:phthalate 4,5-dioxygenase oxygenase subunit